MRFIYFILIVGFLVPKSALAMDLQQEITETSSLYKSCKEFLSEEEDNITENYCFQLISAAGFSIYATRVILAKLPDKTEKIVRLRNLMCWRISKKSRLSLQTTFPTEKSHKTLYTL